MRREARWNPICLKSVNCEIVFRAITDETCGGNVGKAFAVMSNTTSMNTGKKTGIIKYLSNYASENFENDAHAL